MIYVEPKILERVNQWLTPFFDRETQHSIKEMIAYDPEGLEDSFYKDLAFGTGGMRGIMGVGDNRINKYTLGKNTQGLSNYLKKEFPGEKIKAAIAYDCRHNSKFLARVVSEVFAANGIMVYLFSNLRPTPELSFAVRHLKCHCGIVLTASHNPPEYNGYKVYWQDGGQLVPPQDTAVIAEINALRYEQVSFDADERNIQYMDVDIDNAFIKVSIQNGSFNIPQQAKDKLKIVFTPLHGTSVTLMPALLEQAGYHQVSIVESQAVPDGDFPTVVSPNPEEPEALSLALQLANNTDADIVIGTDPDGDRLGIAVRDINGNMTLLNGNQAMVIMTHFLLEQWKKAGKLNGKQFVASTIVSTPMLQKVASSFDVNYMEGLTGFKWIAKMVKDFPDLEFIGGGEESFGYMVGDFIRDKDAMTATLLACEIAAQKKQDGSSMFQYLQKLYQEYGHYKEHLVSVVKKGKKGAEEISEIMKNLRTQPFSEIAGSPVIRIEDYQKGEVVTIKEGVSKQLDIPTSNVLIYFTEDGSKIAIRPSGTEPKIKFYISVNLEHSREDIDTALQKKIDAISNHLKIGS